MIQDKFADKVRAKISPDRTYDASYYNVTPYLDSHGTTHVSVLAEDGMAVSVTSTINHMYVHSNIIQTIYTSSKTQ